MNTGTAWVSLGTGAYETVRAHQAGSWLLGRVRRGKPPRDDVVRRRAFFRLLIVLVSVAMIGSGLMRLVTPHPQATSMPR